MKDEDLFYALEDLAKLKALLEGRAVQMPGIDNDLSLLHVAASDASSPRSRLRESLRAFQRRSPVDVVDF